MKLIMENWRHYLNELMDPAENPEIAPELSQAMAIANSDISFFKAWNSTAGEVLFKIPGTPGAEEYTYGELGLDLGLTLIGVGFTAKAAIKIEKHLMKLYRGYDAALMNRAVQAAATGALILFRKTPSKIKSISAAAAITPEVFLETLVEPVIKDMLLNTKQKREVVEIPQEIASRLNMKMN